MSAEARAASDLPIVASMTFGEELVLLDGTTPEAAAAALIDAGVDAIGVNCGAGPVACLDALVRTGPSSEAIGRSIMPNAGLPQRIAGQFVYAAGPAYFGEMVPGIVGQGARIVGGCCGTTPEHIAAMRAAIDALGAGTSPAASTVEAPAARATPVDRRHVVDRGLER